VGARIEPGIDQDHPDGAIDALGDAGLLPARVVGSSGIAAVVRDTGVQVLLVPSNRR